MKKVDVIIEYADNNLSAYVKDAPIMTVGNTIEEIENNIREAVEFYLEDNENPCEVLCGEFELDFKVDKEDFNEILNEKFKELSRLDELENKREYSILETCFGTIEING